MKPKIILSLLVLLGLAVFSAFKMDEDPFLVLLKKLDDYNQKYPQEKVHLHLDKPYYAIGDNIWFKAYVINTLNSGPSTISTILYVELIDEQDSVRRQLKLPLVDGITWGDLKLTDSLTEGNYRIRAYTQWMRNAGPGFFFDKTIKIGNSWANRVFTDTKYSFSKENAKEKVSTVIKFTDKLGRPYIANDVAYEVQLGSQNIFKGKNKTDNKGEINFDFLNTLSSSHQSGRIIARLTLSDKQTVVKEIPIKATSDTVDVQFFPEGGNLVEELPSKVAIKAVNASGLGQNVHGIVMDNDGMKVTDFKTTDLGMGNFVLNPQPGKSYAAYLKFADSSEQKINLPKAQPSGYVLAVDNTDSAKVMVKVLISQHLLGSGELKLVVLNNGNQYYACKAKGERQVISIPVSKKDLPSGIVQLTLFSPENIPVCERLIFVNNPVDVMSILVKSDKQTYRTRENVAINIQSIANGKPVPGNFSVSVTNNSSVHPDVDNESNIFTTLLLTSDLLGYVEKPNHYFLNQDAKIRQELDNLMLTQGWRRFIWKNIISNNYPVIKFQPEKSLKISGTITTGKNKPVVHGKVSLFSSSGGLFMIDTLSDVNGHFVFDNLIFTDSTRFVVQARTAKNKKYVDIKLDTVPRQMVAKNKNSGDIEVNVNDAISNYIKKSGNYFDELTNRGLLEHSIGLKEVNIVGKKNPAGHSSNINGAGNADAVITAKELTTATSISQFLQGRVAGLLIKNGVPYLMRSSSTPMQIIMDGMPVDSGFLNNINPHDVESIEVLKSIEYTSIYGSKGGGGVLIITTKRGDSDYVSSSYTPGLITCLPKGYYLMRQFYSPKYSTTAKDNHPDLRTTVYWNPNLTTAIDGKAQFNYFNTDEAGTYRVVIEGINRRGQLARTVYTYQVK